MLSHVERFICQHNMLDKSCEHLVALSGGADSVALLLVLSALGYRLHAAHCNFHLRGDESDRDETFVRQLCQRHSIPLHIAHFDTRQYASLHKISIEMAARDLRYSWFEQLRHDIGAQSICVAHHADDSAETVLLNLLRGTGIQGLTGIRPINGHIVRPLLCTRRSDILDYLSAIGQDYVTDSTNLLLDAGRNKIRLGILPLCQDVNPSAVNAINRTSAHLVQASRLLQHAIQSAIQDVVEPTPFGIAINIQSLASQPVPELILFHILKDYAFTSRQTEDIANLLIGETPTNAAIGSIPAQVETLTGKTFTSTTHCLTFHRGRILIERIHTQLPPIHITEDGLYRHGHSCLRVERIARNEHFLIPRTPCCVALDASSIQFPLSLRHCMPGDRFTPFGMRGTKLVSDYLTDQKLSLFDKQRQLVITDATHKILWLVGQRPDNSCCITDSTQDILKLTHITQ